MSACTAIVGSLSSLKSKRPIRRLVVVRTVYPGTVRSRGNEALDQPDVCRRLARQRHHHRGRLLVSAEKRTALRVESPFAFGQKIVGGKGRRARAADTGKGGNHRVEIRHHVAFASTEGRKTQC